MPVKKKKFPFYLLLSVSRRDSAIVGSPGWRWGEKLGLVQQEKETIRKKHFEFSI